MGVNRQSRRPVRERSAGKLLLPPPDSLAQRMFGVIRHAMPCHAMLQQKRAFETKRPCKTCSPFFALIPQLCLPTLHLAPFAFPLSATPNYLSCIRCDVVFKISLPYSFLKAPQLLHDSSIARLSRVQFIFPVAAFAHPVLLPTPPGTQVDPRYVDANPSYKDIRSTPPSLLKRGRFPSISIFALSQ